MLVTTNITTNGVDVLDTSDGTIGTISRAQFKQIAKTANVEIWGYDSARDEITYQKLQTRLHRMMQLGRIEEVLRCLPKYSDMLLTTETVSKGLSEGTAFKERHTYSFSKGSQGWSTMIDARSKSHQSGFDDSEILAKIQGIYRSTNVIDIDFNIET